MYCFNLNTDVSAKGKRKRVHRKVSPGFAGLFAGSYEERRRFGVLDTLSTLGVVVRNLSANAECTLVS